MRANIWREAGWCLAGVFWEIPVYERFFGVSDGFIGGFSEVFFFDFQSFFCFYWMIRAFIFSQRFPGGFSNGFLVVFLGFAKTVSMVL